MKKGSIITFVVALTTLLAVLTGCSGHGTATASSTVPTNIVPTPTQTPGIPSQGGSILSPIILPQGSATGVLPPVVPVPAPGVPSPGISSSGAAVSSAGMGASNAAVSAPGTTFSNQPSFIQPSSGGAQSVGIWVTGQGQVSATPDTASLTLGVNSQATTVAEAQNCFYQHECRHPGFEK